MNSAREVLSNQDGPFKDLEKLVRKYAATEYKRPIADHTRKAFADAEQFIADRCGALESSINGHFPTVRWKLFDVQINGGIVDVCTCMIDCDGALVPYNSANTASQINADIEIVNVLSERYGIRVPLFVDNSERVVSITATDSQLITLAVSMDEELKVEEA